MLCLLISGDLCAQQAPFIVIYILYVFAAVGHCDRSVLPTTKSVWFLRWQVSFLPSLAVV